MLCDISRIYRTHPYHGKEEPRLQGWVLLGRCLQGNEVSQLAGTSWCGGSFSSSGSREGDRDVDLRPVP